MSEPALMEPIYERAFAKLNLLLHVGNPRDDGLHPLCSIFASIDLYDDVHLERAPQDSVECPGIELPDELARKRRAASATCGAGQPPDEPGGGGLEREPCSHPGERSRSLPLCSPCKMSVMI